MGAFIGSAASASGIGASSVVYHCNYRNLVDSQTAVRDRTPLQIDGQRTQGQFNTFGYPLWDSSTSRIIAGNTSQVFDGRLILELTSTVGGALFTIEIDRALDGATATALVYSKQVLLHRLEKTTITEEFTFFVSQSFLSNGGKIWVSSTDPVAIANASLYLFLKGGRP
jgi:hypothetical protein